jgi:tRNA 2-selenouridine synthase
MFKTIPATQIFEHIDNGGAIIDVRSPSEFLDSHIPGAQNISLLDDSERAEIGTLYKQQGGEKALRRALEIFSKPVKFWEAAATLWPKVDEGLNILQSSWPQIFSKIQNCLYVVDGDVKFDPYRAEAELATSSLFATIDVENSVEKQGFKKTNSNLLIYCWRGGARSKTVATVLSLLGFNVKLVEGGHKAFRTEVLNYLHQPKYPFKLCTLYGLTGCGKTKILQRWAQEKKPVIDLEALAHHRGSAFGQIGIAQWGQQKHFENHLYFQMRHWENQKVAVVFVEGESQRIGRVRLSDSFMNAMLEGFHVKVEKTLEERVEHILSEYVRPVPKHDWLKEALRSLEAIQKRLGGEKFKELQGYLFSGQDDLFVRGLLVDYYDKAYLLSRAEVGFYQYVINSDNAAAPLFLDK